MIVKTKMLTFFHDSKLSHCFNDSQSHRCFVRLDIRNITATSFLNYLLCSPISAFGVIECAKDYSIMMLHILCVFIKILLRAPEFQDFNAFIISGK